MIYTVALEDGTVGEINDNCLDGQSPEAFVGEIVNVHLHDENGHEIEVKGRLVEVLANHWRAELSPTYSENRSLEEAMKVREIGETTNFNVSGVDEITGEEISLRVTVFNDLSRVVVSFKAMQISAPFACLSLTKDTLFGSYCLLIRDSEEMPDITFAVTLKKDDFTVLCDHPLLPRLI